MTFRCSEPASADICKPMNDKPIERLEGAFRFKRFTVRQERCAMKVGTDGVLLGAWAPIRETDRRLLDIGTGTGLIALMLCQRSAGSLVTGVDIDDVAQARENGDSSPWGERLQFVQTPIQHFFPPERFDLIVSNPPFYIDSLTSPDAGRTTARHTVHLSQAELIGSVVRLMAPGGRFAVVLPTPEADRFLQTASGLLDLVRRTDVCTTPRRPAKRALMLFMRAANRRDPRTGSGLHPVRDLLVIGTGEHECYTPEYRALTGDFYLKF